MVQQTVEKKPQLSKTVARSWFNFPQLRSRTFLLRVFFEARSFNFFVRV
ncbi:hypothetical protein [Nostoc sp. 'Peltigera malacea cyanobiont' DB3992]|nr:hypothetical protein [Nostoc sp. 'Peltigera malacea cyanobiont' DB3992]